MNHLEDVKLSPRGAPPEALDALGLPKDVRDLLAEHDGGSGKIGNRQFVLLSAAEIADGPEVTAAVPGLVVFATDGGAEGYGWLPRPMRGGRYGRISLLAAGAHEFEPLGETLAGLLEAIAAGR